MREAAQANTGDRLSEHELRLPIVDAKKNSSKQVGNRNFRTFAKNDYL